MKRFPHLLILAAAVLGMAMPACADLISPGELIVGQLTHPLVLLVIVLVLTAVLVRHFTKND